MIDFMVFKQEQTFNGRKVAAAFNIMDLFSNLLISIPVKNQTSEVVIGCLKSIFSMFNVPRKIVSDNAQALCRNPAVLHFLKANNIKQITTTTAHNSQGNKVERIHKTFRDTLQLVKETFKREKQFDMYYTVVHMMNTRPLSLSLHPNVKTICKEMGTEPGVVTPFSLHFGLPNDKHPMIPLENTLQPEDRGEFRAKWKHIITEHDKMLQKELDDRQEQIKRRIIDVGDLVLIRNLVAHKEQLKYYKEVYEVVKINKARYFCAPLFTKGAIMEVNGNNLKPYTYSELFDILPSNIRKLMGENLSPEELKRQSIENPNHLPADLEDWRNWRAPSVPNLRNRITPEDNLSQPALSIVNTDIMSESTDTSSGILSIPDSIPDHYSELNSLFNQSGVSQLRTTGCGLVTKKHRTPQVIKERIPLLQKHPKEKSIEQQAVTVEDVERSWEKKIRKHQKSKQILENIREKQNNTILSAKIPAADLEPTPEQDRTILSDVNFDDHQVDPDVSVVSNSDIAVNPSISKTQTIESPIAENIISSPETLDKTKSSPNTTTASIDKTDTPVTPKGISTIRNLYDTTRRILRSRSRSKEKDLKKPDPVITPINDQRNTEPKRSKSPKLSDITKRLRSRSKIRKPFRFQDPNFTK
jgi:hypothetical protein